MGAVKKFSKWMEKPGIPGKLVDRRSIPKGSPLAQLDSARLALVDLVDGDFSSSRRWIDTKRYASISGLSRRHIAVLANARIAAKGLGIKPPRGGPRFSFPKQLEDIAMKHIGIAKAERKVVVARDIMYEFARLTKWVVLPSSLHYLLKRLGAGVRVTTAGCASLERELLATNGYTPYRAFRVRKKDG